MRLQRYVAKCDVCSRRDAMDLIQQGSIKVNGKIETEPSREIDPDDDSVKLNNKVIKPEDFYYILLNKPAGYVTTKSDPYADKTVFNLIPKKYKFVSPVGRLDKDTEGLLLLTNDGKLQHKIANPKKKTPKTYWVQVEGTPSENDLIKLRNGVELKDGMTLPARVQLMSSPNIWKREPPIRERANIPTTWLEITITEGRNRQVRRMTANIGFPTLRLIRFSIGQWTINNIANGGFKVIE